MEYRFGDRTYLIQPGGAFTFAGQVVPGPVKLLGAHIRFVTIIMYQSLEPVRRIFVELRRIGKAKCQDNSGDDANASASMFDAAVGLPYATREGGLLTRRPGRQAACPYPGYGLRVPAPWIGGHKPAQPHENPPDRLLAA
jgi:hypothetical protein